MNTDRDLKYAKYEEVIFYRKKWVWVLLFLLLTPVGILIGLTGDVYTQQNGQLTIFPKSVRLTLSLGFGLLILIKFFGPIFIHQ